MTDLSYYKGKNVLVTGGCGLIGIYLSKELVKLGAKVTVFDNNLRNVGEDIKSIEGDIANPEQVAEAVKDKDVVFHLAAILGVEKIHNVPLEVLKVNIGGTVNVLEAGHKYNVSKVIVASSSEVYGEPRTIPIKEEDATAPISIYGIAKLASEGYAKSYYEEKKLNTVIIRYFNVYGPYQTNNFVVPIFISRVLENEAPVIYGDGSQSRCYTYVEDAVRGTLLAGCSEKAIGEVFNIGNNEITIIKDLANHIISLSGKNLTPVNKEFGGVIRVEKREILKRQPDISKAQKLLGFDITIDWREGINRYFEWFAKKEGRILPIKKEVSTS